MPSTQLPTPTDAAIGCRRRKEKTRIVRACVDIDSTLLFNQPTDVAIGHRIRQTRLIIIQSIHHRRIGRPPDFSKRRKTIKSDEGLLQNFWPFVCCVLCVACCVTCATYTHMYPFLLILNKGGHVHHTSQYEIELENWGELCDDHMTIAISLVGRSTCMHAYPDPTPPFPHPSPSLDWPELLKSSTLPHNSRKPLQSR